MDSGVVECRLEITDREDRESDAIRKDGVRGGVRDGLKAFGNSLQLRG